MGKINEDKKATAEERMTKINLLQSGYAGLNSRGQIVDRRKQKEAKAFSADPSLSIPEPKK